MAYCPKCGVELAPEAPRCPLCGTANTLASCDEAAPARPSERIPDPADLAQFTEVERRTIAWEILSVSAIIASAVVGAVNLLESRTLSWALYPLASLALIWVLATVPLKLRSLPVLAGCILAAAAPAFLVALDSVDGRLDWAPRVAVPIALIAELSAALGAYAGFKAKRKGPNIIAFALLAATASCLGIESALDLNTYGELGLQWSAIVASALVPVAIFFLYLHHRVVKKANLRKLFRL